MNPDVNTTMVFKRYGRTRRFRGRRGNRRFGRTRKGFRRTKRNFATTSIHGQINSLGFRGRRMGIRRFRAGIFRDTLYKPHYRSILARTLTHSTGTTAAFNAPGFVYPEVGATLQDAFWEAAGGAVAIDESVSLPNFIGDVTIRGGTIGIDFVVADSVTDLIGVRVYLCFGKQGHSIPSNNSLWATSQPWGWDPSAVADLSTLNGIKVLKNWTGYINYTNKSFSVDHRLRPRKVDQQPYITANADAEGAQFLYLYHIVNLTSTTSVSVGVIPRHNLSFSGDADTIV